MPLKSGSSQKTISKNIAELTGSKPSSVRAKGITTLAKRRGISPEKAKQIQSQAIAFSKAREDKKGKYPIPNKY